MRGKFKSYEYQSVILPIIVIRRLECVLIKWREDKANVEKFVTVHGQEISPTNYAVCRADLLIKNDRQPTVHLGNSLIPHDAKSREPGDQWPENKWKFDRMLSNQLGYEILPNKYFYRYQPPTPAKDLLKEFWRPEKVAEKLLEGLAQ